MVFNQESIRKERYWKERDTAIINSSNWYKNNIEMASKTRRNYYMQHREIIIKHIRVWYRNNLLKARAQNRKYYINNHRSYQSQCDFTN